LVSYLHNNAYLDHVQYKPLIILLGIAIACVNPTLSNTELIYYFLMLQDVRLTPHRDQAGGAEAVVSLKGLRPLIPTHFLLILFQ